MRVESNTWFYFHYFLLPSLRDAINIRCRHEEYSKERQRWTSPVPRNGFPSLGRPCRCDISPVMMGPRRGRVGTSSPALRETNTATLPAGDAAAAAASLFAGGH